jgi:hypothetical protein
MRVLVVEDERRCWPRTCGRSGRGPDSEPGLCVTGPARFERRTHHSLRHGTTTLFAAVEVATGWVTDAYQPRHRHRVLLDFLTPARQYVRKVSGISRPTTATSEVFDRRSPPSSA